MKPIINLLILLLLLIPCSSFSKPIKRKIKVKKDRISITVKFKKAELSYIYYRKTKKTKYVMKNELVKLVAKLDKKDCPQEIIMHAGGEKFPFPKKNPKNKTLYEGIKKDIKMFVKVFRVKQVLKKYKKNKSRR